MKISLGKRNKKDGTVALEGTLSQEEVDFILGVGFAEILNAGVYAIMEERAQMLALAKMQHVGPEQ